MTRPVEDDMIEHGNPQGLSGGDKLLGNLQVFNTGIEIAGRRLWARITADTRSVIGSAKTSRGWTWVLLTKQIETTPRLHVN
jgi:hypothetical protein